MADVLQSYGRRARKLPKIDTGYDCDTMTLKLQRLVKVLVQNFAIGAAN